MGTSKKRKKYLILKTALLALLLARPTSSQAAFFYDTLKDNFQKVGLGSGFITDLEEKPDFIAMLGAYVNGLLGLMGIVFLILIIYGGFIWMTAAGNEEKITKAKKIIAGSAIGIGIIFLAMTITMLILGIFKIAGA